MQKICLLTCGGVQVLESVWSVLVSNVALLVNVVISIVSMVFGGGTAILNSVLEVVSTHSLLIYCLFSVSMLFCVRSVI